MRSSLSFLLFVLITVVGWGVLGPVLHIGQQQMGDGKSLAVLRPLIGVGIAWFLVATIYPMFVLTTSGEDGDWSVAGFFWSFIAGAVSLLGLLGVIFAFKFNGDPVYVMPLVFCCAPVANTIVNMLFSGTIRQASMLFYISVLIIAIGAAGLFMFKPTKPTGSNEDQTARLTLVSFQQTEPESDAEDSDPGQTELSEPAPVSSGATDFLMVGMCIAAAALCWGAYGPILRRGQARMNGSYLRPFLCVGLAYFTFAIATPLLLLSTFPDPGGWSHVGGLTWSMLAGAAGATGALGLLLALNRAGANPVFVMPLVFGVVPVVNTITETVYKGLYGQIEYTFWISLMLVIFGAVLVLICAPSPRIVEKTKAPAEAETGGATDSDPPIHDDPE